MYYTVIPARNGSKSIIDKNICDLDGYPILAYSIIAAKQAGLPNIFVSTNDPIYVDIAKKYNANTILRPEITCTDKATDFAYLTHFIFEQNLKEDDQIILLRPTTPIRNPKLLSDALQIDLEYYTSLRSIHALPESPYKMFKKLDNMLAPYIGDDLNVTNLPKQIFDICYSGNGYIDILKVDQIMYSKNIYGNKIYGFETESIIELDSKEELEMLRYQVKNNNPLKEFLC